MDACLPTWEKKKKTYGGLNSCHSAPELALFIQHPWIWLELQRRVETINEAISSGLSSEAHTALSTDAWTINRFASHKTLASFCLEDKQLFSSFRRKTQFFYICFIMTKSAHNCSVGRKKKSGAGVVTTCRSYGNHTDVCQVLLWDEMRPFYLESVIDHL